jgi:hypothetical protein
MKQNSCDKILLADTLGIKLIYCKNCEVVELELGAISIRLSPDSIQRLANVMMKASLNLDKIGHQIQKRTTNEHSLLH